MSQSATPATQNDMTTCSETFEKERFCGFLIDTAKLQENQKLETRRVRAPKRAFRARHPPIFTLCSLKIVFLGASKFNYLKIDVSCEGSVNFHGICTLSPLDAALPMDLQKKNATGHV